MNRIAEALKTLGGSGTAQDIQRLVGGRPCVVSANLSALERRGIAQRAGVKSIVVKRWRGKCRINAAIWRLM